MSTILDRQWEQIRRFFEVFSDETRIKILQILNRERMRVTDLHETFNKETKQSLTRPAISHHLKKLLDANLINSEQEGQSIYYFINQNDLREELNIAQQSFERTFLKK